MPAVCPGCGCRQGDAASRAAHAVIAALVADDLDRAIESGLLSGTDCNACTAPCQVALRAARAQRRSALAARERHRDRAARLELRARERDARRSVRPVAAPSETKPSLPPAAAAALARAKAKAAQRGPR